MVNAKTLLFGSATTALAALAVGLFMITTAGAQPPGPPSVFFGPVSGGPEPGHSIVAFVVGDRTLNCGAGEVTEEDGETVYVIDVNSDGGVDYNGCAREGNQVRFYFPETKQFANELGTWSVLDDPDDIEPFPLTAGAALGTGAYAPNSASDRPFMP